MTIKDKQFALDAVVILACLSLAIYVAASSSAVYEKTPRVVLFTVVSLLVAVLFATRAQAKFDLKLPGMVFTATGAMAVFMGLIVVLSYLTKSDDRVMVLSFKERSGIELPLDTADLRITTLHGRNLEKCIEGSRAYVILSDDIPGISVTVADGNLPYQWDVPPSAGRTLQIGKAIK